MENQKNNKGVNSLLIVIIVILSVLCILFATGTICFKSNDVDNNDINKNNKQESNTIKSLIDSVKISNFSFGRPEAVAFGGETINTISINTNFNLDCSKDDGIAGVTLKGYCTDKNDKKYSIVGPLSVMAFYCDNNISHTDTGVMYVNQMFDENGVPHDIDWANVNNIKWNDIEIKYCKIENANIRLSDGSDIVTNIEFSYEKEY